MDRSRSHAHRLRVLPREPVLPPGRRSAVVPEEFLIAIGPWLIQIFWGTALLWAAVSAYTLAGWRSAERRAAALASARRALEDPVTDAGSILRTLSARAADELAASQRHEDRAADRAAALLVAEHPQRVLRRASRGRPWWRRAEALRILVRAGHPDRIGCLGRALRDGPPELSAVAIALLGRVPDRKAASILLEAFEAEAHPASRIATALEDSAGTLTDLLTPRLRHPSPTVRYWSACLIAEDSPNATAALGDLAREDDPRLRKAAVRALARIGSGRAEAESRRLLGDPVGYVRAHAARALVETLGPAAHDALDGLASDADWSVRCALRELLGPSRSAETAP